jgi:hypothetical protein
MPWFQLSSHCRQITCQHNCSRQYCKGNGCFRWEGALFRDPQAEKPFITQNHIWHHNYVLRPSKTTKIMAMAPGIFTPPQYNEVAAFVFFYLFLLVMLQFNIFNTDLKPDNDHCYFHSAECIKWFSGKSWKKNKVSNNWQSLSVKVPIKQAALHCDARSLQH